MSYWINGVRTTFVICMRRRPDGQWTADEIEETSWRDPGYLQARYHFLRRGGNLHSPVKRVPCA